MEKSTKAFLVMVMLLLVTGLIIVQAQTAAPLTGSSIGFTSNGTFCDVPTPGRTILCGTGTTVYISVNGGAFVDMKGPAGLPGKDGAAGATGATGPAGSSTTLSSFSCSSIVVTAAGVTGSGCSFK